MSPLYIVASIAFFIWVLRNVLFWVYLWQLKEYRLDRFIAHIKETYQGRNLLLSPFLLIKFLIILSFIFVVFDKNLVFPYEFAIAIIFGMQALIVIKEIASRSLKRPQLTYKAIILTVLPLFIVSFLYSFALINNFLWLLLLDRFTSLLVALFVYVMSFPSEFFIGIQTDKAIEKMRSVSHVLTIGVTGSYGKSSTKEYIAQILAHKFQVVKTEGTNNTLIGVVNTTLRKLKKSTEIFVVEMGAYKKGEIAQICLVAQPKIGVLTAVSEQHLSLFGSLKNTMDAKYELIEYLPTNGLALFNANNTNAYKLYNKSKKPKALYQVFQWMKSPIDREFASKRSTVSAFNVLVHKTFITFDVYLKGKILHLKTPLAGAQNIENILPGIYIANYLGMKDSEIKKAVEQLKPLAKTMVRVELPSGVSVIDDTFNANPDAVHAALNYMKIYKGKKILVLNPMIELGTDLHREHYEIGQEIGKVCNFVFLTNKNFLHSIQKGITDSQRRCTVKVASPSHIADFVNKNTGKDDIIVFEGKEAGLALDKIL